MNYLKEASDVAKKAFDEYDKNKDGLLSKAELIPLLEKVAKALNLPKPSDKDVEEGIRNLDLNKNGVLEFNEFFNFFREVYQDLKDH